MGENANKHAGAHSHEEARRQHGDEGYGMRYSADERINDDRPFFMEHDNNKEKNHD